MNITIKLFNDSNLPDRIYKRLIENNFVPKFSINKKLYYKFIRPFLPRYFRKKLQEKVGTRITCKENFIDNLLLKEIENNNRLFPTNLIYPNNKDTAIILTHDVEEENGLKFIPSVLELEERYGFKSSWNIVPYKYKIDQNKIELIKNYGHEIGIHGYNHDGKLYFSEKIFNERAPYINSALKKYGAIGFRSPMVHRNLEWLQKLEIEYDASCFDYDPFQPFPGGTGSIWPFIAGKFVELPYTLPQDHTIYYVLKQRDISIWKNKTEWVTKNKGVILIITHPDYLIEKPLFKMYEEFLDYLNSIENAWRGLPSELSNWWKTKFS